MDIDFSIFQGDSDLKQTDIAESFEDPFSIRFFPAHGEIANRSRFFCLGKTLSGDGVFSVYSANGKQVKMVMSRPMTDEEVFFYERKVKEAYR